LVRWQAQIVKITIKDLQNTLKAKEKCLLSIKKDVLGKERNVYKFIGDRKQYIKYKNEYVLL
tara:strand:+ start:1363 stop:1548 length:186 start_codon:yes stop_codon:yes gene_type:complete